MRGLVFAVAVLDSARAAVRFRPWPRRPLPYAARYASTLVLLALLASCTRNTVIVTPDAGAMTDASVDAALEIDAGPLPEPLGGSECDQQDDCAACLSCTAAPREICNSLALQCEDDAECVALTHCINGCSESETGCVRACGAAHPSATSLFVRVYECAICTGCPADCRELGPTWCEDPPF